MEETQLLYKLIILLALNSASPAIASNLEGITDQITAKIAKESDQFKEIVTQNEKRVIDEREFYKDLVSKTNEALGAGAKALEKGVRHLSENSIVKQIIKNHKLNKEPKTNQGLMIFVSFSMPNELLWSYMEQAKHYNGRLVIRGLVENSFKKTIQAMDLGENRKLVLDVNPKAFKEFNVAQVPSIVLSNGKQYDKFTGSVSVSYALEEIKSKGDLKEHKLLERSR